MRQSGCDLSGAKNCSKSQTSPAENGMLKERCMERETINTSSVLLAVFCHSLNCARPVVGLGVKLPHTRLCQHTHHTRPCLQQLTRLTKYTYAHSLSRSLVPSPRYSPSHNLAEEPKEGNVDKGHKDLQRSSSISGMAGIQANRHTLCKLSRTSQPTVRSNITTEKTSP